MPTMAVVLGAPRFWAMAPHCGIDWPNVLNAEERLRIARPLDPSGVVVGHCWVSDLAEKDVQKSAQIRSVKVLHTPTELLLAETVFTWIVRSNWRVRERELTLSR